MVPLHATTVERLDSYLAFRDEHFPEPRSESFFVSTVGRRIGSGNLRGGFRRGCRAGGTSPRSRGQGPISAASATPSLSRPSSPGMRTGPRWHPGCRCFRPTSAMSAPPPRTGTSRPRHDCWRWRREVQRRDGNNDAPRSDAPGVLHPASRGPTRVRARTRSPPIATPSGCFSSSPRNAPEPLRRSSAIEDLDATLISSFLDALETERHVSVKTRNSRLSAIHSLFSFAALQHPEHADLIQRVLSIPAKRALRPLVSYLSVEEVDALIAAPDQRLRTGRRDVAMLAVAVQTGLRVSELAGLRRGDVTFGSGACVSCVGKGRKQRSTPLRPETTKVLRRWMDECGGQPDAPVFPGPRGGPLQPRHDCENRRPAFSCRFCCVSIDCGEKGDAARAPPQLCDATAGRGRRCRQ